MVTGSKLEYFLFVILTTYSLSACERRENDVIPDVYVDFTMNLNDIEFVNLTTLFGSVYVNANTNNWGLKAAGYEGNGIIVFAGPNDEFYAYDRTCPHDYVVNKLLIKVSVVDIIYAECPQCKTRYALTNLGTPVIDTIGRYPLKNYRTSSDGLYVRVWNY